MTPDETATTSVHVPGQREPQQAPPRPHSSSMWRLVELEATTSRDFDDPKLEWRRLFSELLGAFLLVFVGAGGAGGNPQRHGAVHREGGAAAPAPPGVGVLPFMGPLSRAPPKPPGSPRVAA